MTHTGVIPMLVAVVGPPAAGKSTLVARLAARLRAAGVPTAEVHEDDFLPPAPAAGFSREAFRAAVAAFRAALARAAGPGVLLAEAAAPNASARRALRRAAAAAGRRALLVLLLPPRARCLAAAAGRPAVTGPAAVERWFALYAKNGGPAGPDELRLGSADEAEAVLAAVLARLAEPPAAPAPPPQGRTRADALEAASRRFLAARLREGGGDARALNAERRRVVRALLAGEPGVPGSAFGAALLACLARVGVE